MLHKAGKRKFEEGEQCGDKEDSMSGRKLKLFRMWNEAPQRWKVAVTSR